MPLLEKFLPEVSSVLELGMNSFNTLEKICKTP